MIISCDQLLLKQSIKLMDLRLERGIQIDSNELIHSKNSKNILNNFIKIAEEYYNEKTNI